jgi:hypothetical protein
MNMFACLSLILALFAGVAQAQDMTELKVVNGSQESEVFQVVIAIASSEGDAPMVAKIVKLGAFGEFDLFSIPKSDQIMIGALPQSIEIAELSNIPDEYKELFTPISLESAASCDVIIKGSFADGMTFTLSNLQW